MEVTNAKDGQHRGCDGGAGGADFVVPDWILAVITVAPALRPDEALQMDALYSTVLVTALFNFYNRLVDGVGLTLTEGYEAEAGKRLSTQGYDVFAQMAKPGPIAAADLNASNDE